MEEKTAAEIAVIDGQIRGYQIQLEQTDYMALKHADGALSDEEYEQTRTARAEWRARINELQAYSMSLTEEAAAATAEAPKAWSAGTWPLGSKVAHAGKVWVSSVDNNIWEPGATGSEAVWTVSEG